jgi:hypothetical protein
VRPRVLTVAIEQALAAVLAQIVRHRIQEFKHIVSLSSIQFWAVRIFLVIIDLHRIVVCHSVRHFQSFVTEEVSSMSTDKTQVGDGCQNPSV